MFRLVLEVLGGDGPSDLREFTLKERQKISVGRERCDLVLKDRTVSRRHLGFAVKGGKLLAGDLGSSHGTLHNGRSLHRARAVKGDLFQVGCTTVLVKSFAAVEKPAFAWTAWRPRNRRAWSVGLSFALLVLVCLPFAKPAKVESEENPFAPVQAGFDAGARWREMRDWVRARTYALRREDPSKEVPVDYDRVFGD